MAKEVIKKDGSREPFDPEKLRESIRAAAEMTDLPQDRVEELVQEVGDVAIEAAEQKEVIGTFAIREAILRELDQVEPSVSEAWRAYEG